MIFDTPPLPPHSIEAEQAVLAAVILNQEAFDVIERREPLVPADFYEPLHQFLWERFQREHTSGHRLDFKLALMALGEAGSMRFDQGDMTVSKYVAELIRNLSLIHI